jgi:diaminopimelate epimerase
MRFEKWQALGNDYIVVERDEIPFTLSAGRIAKICEGHFGVFSDGMLVLSRTDREDLVATLEIYNPDGSRAELSGNGAREAILYLRHRGWTDEDDFSIQTDAGIVTPHITGPETCRVDMGAASLTSKDYPDGPADGAGEIETAGRSWRFQHVSIGNPQCAMAVEDLAALEALDLPAIGPGIESDPRFPNRTNVSWFAEIAPARDGQPARIRARIFERGVGETLSSGTGATGAAIAYALRGGGIAEGGACVHVVLDGGELLVEVGEDLHVDLTGWARPVFEGRLSDRFIKELHETE